jgi:hypothetical protein
VLVDLDEHFLIFSSEIEIGKEIFAFLLPVTSDQPIEETTVSYSDSPLETHSTTGGAGYDDISMRYASSSDMFPWKCMSADRSPYYLYPSVKPPHSYTRLIAEAILISPDQRLSLSGICSYLRDTYPYFRYTSTSWQVG